MSLPGLSPCYQMDQIISIGKESSVEVAGPMVMEPYTEENDPFYSINDYLFVQAEIKSVKQGNPASNLRFTKDKDMNNKVVENMYNLYKTYLSLNTHPVVITSYPRDQRYISFKMNEDGTFTITNKKTDDDYHDIFNQFLHSANITKEMVQIMRLSSERSKFNTYLADIISLLLKVNYFHMPNLFEEKTLTPEIIPSNDERFYGIVIDGKPWYPVDGLNYLYYTEKQDKHVRQKFMVPKKDTIDKIYSQMWNLLSNEDNGIKSMVRNFFTNSLIVRRWSDYWECDIDDWLTILTIINSFKYTNITYQEQSVLKQLESIVQPFYENMKSQLMSPQPEPEPEPEL